MLLQAVPKNSRFRLSGCFADRRVFDKENPEKGITFVEAVWLAEEKFGTLGTMGSYTPPATPGKFKGSTVGPSPATAIPRRWPK